MIYLQNNSDNEIYVTFNETTLSGTGEYLLNITNEGANKEFYCVVSAETITDRYDLINLPLTGTSNYFYSIPLQKSGFYKYNAYELYSGITSGITSEMLSGNTIDISTACTSTVILESGCFDVSGDSLNNVVVGYTPTNNGYISYK